MNCISEKSPRDGVPERVHCLEAFSEVIEAESFGRSLIAKANKGPPTEEGPL